RRDSPRRRGSGRRPHWHRKPHGAHPAWARRLHLLGRARPVRGRLSRFARVLREGDHRVSKGPRMNAKPLRLPLDDEPQIMTAEQRSVWIYLAATVLATVAYAAIIVPRALDN